ncbi:VOC family protein [Altererythrobacter aerius]|uniref:VOC family protein n=1 Tax=Tsuneonella aeria TaxID=1837929 RepID=A0A6I4TCK9_9SPHN|nr:VOC family protein [Tsuneonella aeria]MXO74336.1 VOC family protein [Tsuneonella aeria]
MGAIDQIGHVTADLDAAVAMWTSHLGVGPWTVYRNVRLTGDYRGLPADVTIDVALGYRGTVQIELIQPTSDAPSPYRDDDGTLREGVHHLAWVVEDFDTAVALLGAHGLAPVFKAGNSASQVAYFEPAPGVVWELIAGEGMRAMMDAGMAAAAGWDGRDPVTEIDLAA